MSSWKMQIWILINRNLSTLLFDFPTFSSREFSSNAWRYEGKALRSLNFPLIFHFFPVIFPAPQFSFGIRFSMTPNSLVDFFILFTKRKKHSIKGLTSNWIRPPQGEKYFLWIYTQQFLQPPHKRNDFLLLSRCSTQRRIV